MRLAHSVPKVQAPVLAMAPVREQVRVLQALAEAPVSRVRQPPCLALLVRARVSALQRPVSFLAPPVVAVAPE